MRRFRNFWMFQRAAWRSLFRRRRVRLIDLPSADESAMVHPSELCKCFADEDTDQIATVANPGHRSDCQWLAAMCIPCGGTGWCEHCGGDGTKPPPGQVPPDIAAVNRAAVGS